MRHWAELLGTLGAVRTLDYPYMLEGRRRPDRLSQLVAAHRASLVEVRQAHAGPIILIGKSMGSRIGCHVSLEEKISALICLSYPLCGSGDPAKLRDKVLREITTPILFVQGTRDPLCPLDLLERVRSEMVAARELYVVEGGDHSLLVRKMELKAKGETQADIEGRILQVIGRFVAEHAHGSRR